MNKENRNVGKNIDSCLEAVHTEGVEAHHTVYGAVVTSGHSGCIAPVSLLALPHLQLSDE